MEGCVRKYKKKKEIAGLLPGARHCFKYAICVNSFNRQNKTVMFIPASSTPTARVLKQGTKAKRLPRISQAVSGRGGR